MWANLNLNFGVVALETIRQAYIAGNDDEDLQRVHDIYKSYSKKLSENLSCYVIETNSTASIIKIVAAGVSFE